MKRFILAAMLFVASCERAPVSANDPAVTYLPTRELPIAGRIFKLEVADDPEERRIGLMHRKQMPADHGMIFVFDRPQEQSFWMKNTLLPLDIIYTAADGKVVSIRQMQPLDLTGIPSNGPAKYAIELNVGTAERIGLKPGDTIAIPDDLDDNVK